MRSKFICLPLFSRRLAAAHVEFGILHAFFPINMTEACNLCDDEADSLRDSGTPAWTTSDPSCLYPVNQYLWLNNLHPTYPIHNATAASIVKTLG